MFVNIYKSDRKHNSCKRLNYMLRSRFDEYEINKEENIHKIKEY